jgi:RND family efflux transporter MFP subunit
MNHYKGSYALMKTYFLRTTLLLAAVTWTIMHLPLVAEPMDSSFDLSHLQTKSWTKVANNRARSEGSDYDLLQDSSSNRLLSPNPNLSSSKTDEFDFSNQTNGFSIVLDPLYRTMLSAEVISPVKRILHRMGDSVQQGDLLIELDDRIFQAAYEKALAVVEKTKTELLAQSELFQDGLASLFEFKEAEANFASAESDFASASHALNCTRIRSPYDGKVVALFVEEDELPANNIQRNENREMIVLLYDRVLMGKMLIPSKLLPKVHLDDEISIQVRETGETITAIIRHISPVIDPTSATLKIEAEVSNHQGKLLAGMTGLAYLTEQRSKQAASYENRLERNEGFEQPHHQNRADSFSTYENRLERDGGFKQPHLQRRAHSVGTNETFSQKQVAPKTFRNDYFEESNFLLNELCDPHELDDLDNFDFSL